MHNPSVVYIKDEFTIAVVNMCNIIPNKGDKVRINRVDYRVNSRDFNYLDNTITIYLE